MRKTLLTTAIGTVLMGSVAMSAHASNEPQGMYSADDILDAEVYFANDPDEEIGDVDDILFDEEMRISAIVIESGSVLSLGGREIVIDTDYFTLETETEADGDTEHRIMVEASQEEVEDFPEYNNEWWEETKTNARSAWETTQEGAQSAWQQTREALDLDDNDNG